MRSLLLREMLLTSFVERKALRVRFHPKATVIQGENQTGKSSVIKSILLTFGAPPARVPPKWEAADVRSLVRFAVDGLDYSLLRYGGNYAAFDRHGKLMGRFGSVTKELAPFLADLLGFGLRLPDRERKPTRLPPAYYFLPFYVDQDDGWSSQWSGFARLQQFAAWRKGLVEYHAGIRGNDFYETQAARAKAEVDLGSLQRKRDSLEAIYEGLRDRFEAAQFDIDFDAFREDVDKLLRECEQLRQVEERYKVDIADLRNAREAIKTQLDITVHARDEARRDYDYATELAEADEVRCPTCGAGYSNAFADRFSIALDEDQCAGLALRLAEDLKQVETRIARELDKAHRTTAEIGKIEKLLAKRDGEIAIGDLIRHAGRRELRDVMHQDLGAIEADAAQLSRFIEEQSKRIRALDSPEHRALVNGSFEELARSFLARLDVSTIPDAEVRTVHGKFGATGSEAPRALLGYKMAFFHVLRRFGSAAVAPLIVDSPNQQDQDPGHLQRILRFVNAERPSDSQLVLGTVDPGGVDFGGGVVRLTRRYSALSEDEFPEVASEMSQFIDLALHEGGPEGAPSTR